MPPIPSTAPVQVGVALLKAAMPDLVLRPGAQVVARVASLGAQQRASLVIANHLIAARVPAGVEQGDVLRLRVAEATEERILLRISAVEPLGGDEPAARGEHAPAAPTPQPQQHHLAGAMLAAHAAQPQVSVTDRGTGGGEGQEHGGEDERASVALDFAGQALGRLGLQVAIGPEGVLVRVSARAGASHDAVSAAARELRECLEHRLQRPALITTEARHEPISVTA